MIPGLTMVMGLVLVVRTRVRANSSLLFRMFPGESYGWPPEKLCLHVAYVDFDGGAAIEAQDVECSPVLLHAFPSSPPPPRAPKENRSTSKIWRVGMPEPASYRS